MTTIVNDLHLNGIDVAVMRQEQDQARREPAAFDYHPRLTAHWVGGTRARVEMGDLITHMGGKGEPDAMQALLAALAACDVEVIALHAALLGIPVEHVSVEAEGYFNIAAYLGVEDAPGSGYQTVRLTARLRAPDANPEQISRLRSQLEHSSPVGDSLARAVSLEVKLEVEG
jgi:uncharacterized OsmC-like protein